MKKTLSFYLLPALLLCGQATYSQQTLRGQVSEAVSGEPLPLVNIGVKGKNAGTISQTNGSFLLSIPALLLIEDSLTFSAPGYREKSFFIPSFSKGEELEIFLQPMPVPVKKERLSQKKWKEKTVGAKNTSLLLHGLASSRKGDILEIAQPIKVRKKPVQLLQARLYLNSTNQDSSSFRVKIYTSEEGQPGALLMAKNILLRKKAEKGWITAELEELGLVMEEDFFISFEFIPEGPEATTNLVYGGQIGKGRGLSRSSSLGEWEEAPCSYAVQALIAVQR